MTTANVKLWGRRIGAISWDASRAIGVFQYDPDFCSFGIPVAPLTMAVGEEPYDFPALNRETFHGLPGLLADALPDLYGSRLIDMWLTENNRRKEDFSPVDRLCYIGNRGIGALEFEPAILRDHGQGRIDFDALVDLARRVLAEREDLAGRLGTDRDQEALKQILSVGTSAGGARAKAVIGWHPETGEFRSGQVDTEAGFEHWLLKFDGVSESQPDELADPAGYGRIEYAYYRMARAAGIQMTECRLHHEGGRSHFMTRRFDRTPDGDKIHVQSLGAMCHFDYKEPGAHSYEQAVQAMRKLGMETPDVAEQFRRAIFNVTARNQDDHVKNISFLMNRRGEWRLSPAYDVAYSYRPSGLWTRDHQMRLAGKINDFTSDDLLKFSDSCGLARYKARQIMAEVFAAVRDWPRYANEAGVEKRRVENIAMAHRDLVRHGNRPFPGEPRDR